MNTNEEYDEQFFRTNGKKAQKSNKKNKGSVRRDRKAARAMKGIL